MAIWTLDSCGSIQNCVVEIDINANFVRFVSKCPAHAAITDDVNGFNEITAENRRGQGNVLWEIAQRAPAAMVDTLPDGSKTFKPGINVTWNWSGVRPNRVLNINVIGITPTTTQQNAIKSAIDNRFGTGRIVITFS